MAGLSGPPIQNDGAWPALQTDGGNACFGNLSVFVGLDTAHAYSTPRQKPSFMMGTPPSNMPWTAGALRNDTRPPLIASSYTLLSRRPSEPCALWPGQCEMKWGVHRPGAATTSGRLRRQSARVMVTAHWFAGFGFGGSGNGLDVGQFKRGTCFHVNLSMCIQKQTPA